MTLICNFEFSDWEFLHIYVGNRRSRDRMVVEFTTTSAISTYTDVVSSNLDQGEVYNIMW